MASERLYYFYLKSTVRVSLFCVYPHVCVSACVREYT